MSKLAHSNQDTMDEIEQRALFEPDMETGARISEDEAFSILSESGIDEIKWNASLNQSYAQWQYLNLK